MTRNADNHAPSGAPSGASSEAPSNASTDAPSDIPRAARGRPPLPGGPVGEALAHRMLRVDHAGEFGAVRIYQGQLAVLGASPATAASAALVREMKAEEDRHLAAFDRLLPERGVRPTALQPLWSVAGFALGAATALMGEKAAMACTTAVEEAIVEHYEDQLVRLGDDDPELSQTIAEFRDDEMRHHDVASDAGAREAPGYGLLSAAIRTGCRLAITLSERV